MKRIGLLSDTHGYWDERYLKYFDTCDEIWHAGDIGSQEVADRLAPSAPSGPYMEISTVRTCVSVFRKSTASN